MVLSPVMNSCNFDGIASDEHFLNGTLELMSRCDKVIVIARDWERSVGTRGEVEKAFELGMNVIMIDDKKLECYTSEGWRNDN